MKVFISWSGELSKNIAEVIKKWLPCIIQSVEVFFSPDDIEKGENWDTKVSTELLECKYGIICLTKENVSAPWIHFESGALAKALDSRVATLMINVTPTDIKGPLSRYQATKLDKDDFFQLIKNINEQLETQLNIEVLKTLFNTLWDKINNDFKNLLEKYQDISPKKKKGIKNDEALDEILLLLRKLNSTVSSPTNILPPDYISGILETSRRYDKGNEIYHNQLLFQLLDYIGKVLAICKKDKDMIHYALELKIPTLLSIVRRNINRHAPRSVLIEYEELHNSFDLLYNDLYLPEPQKEL